MKTNDLIRCSNSFSQRWITHQLYGDMTAEKHGALWCIDHCCPLPKTSLSNENEKYISTNWIKLRPTHSSENSSRGSKTNHRLYLMQEIKANCFLELNAQEILNKIFHWWNKKYST